MTCRRPQIGGVAAALVAALALCGNLGCRSATNSRNWAPNQAVLSTAEFNGNLVTVHNVRNTTYRTAEDYTVRHYDKTFDLDQLRTADLYMVYWGSPYMAHTMVSFGFTGGDYVCFSIETRKEKGEDYSAVKGLFRQFELTYIVADEQDSNTGLH